jgi:hypothetical protein
MATVAEHDDDHLGPGYTWMLRDFGDAVVAAQDEVLAADVALRPAMIVVGGWPRYLRLWARHAWSAVLSSVIG